MRQNNFKEDPRGPVANARMKVEADAEGVRAVGYHFDPAAVRKFAPWRAEWVKPSGMCRRKVFLASHPRSVRAWISAESRYKLYINCRLASRGPADAGQDGAWGGKVRNALGRCGKIDLSSGIIFYDFRDLTMVFRKGTNMISIEVAGNHSFIFEAEVILTGGCRKIIKSDLSWSGASRDRGRHPPFIQSEIPPLMECAYPVSKIVRATQGVKIPPGPFARGHSVVMSAPGSFAVKFDRVLSACIALKVRGGKEARLIIQGNEIDVPGGMRKHEVL